MRIVLALLVLFICTPVSAVEQVSPPKYNKDPMQNSAMGALPSFLDSDVIDLSQECSKIKGAVTNFIGINGACKADVDCVNIPASCPFGCSITVNATNKNAVIVKIDSYNEICGQCEYKCRATTLSPVCKSGRCTRSF